MILIEYIAPLKGAARDQTLKEAEQVLSAGDQEEEGGEEAAAEDGEGEGGEMVETVKQR